MGGRKDNRSRNSRIDQKSFAIKLYIDGSEVGIYGIIFTKLVSLSLHSSQLV